MYDADNIVMQVIEMAAEDGFPPSAVQVSRSEDAGPWTVRVTRMGFVPHGEGGDVMDRHQIAVDRRDLPKGVSILGGERVEDFAVTIEDDNWLNTMEEIVIAAARLTDSIDVKITDYAGIHVSMLFKPNKYLPDSFFGTGKRPANTNPRIIRAKG
jgi:hypothetical protein